MEYSSAFVCLLGLGTVFFGLICIILLSDLMSFLCRGRRKAFSLPNGDSLSAPGQPGRQEWIAAVSAALAEELGTDLSGLRILSVKRI